ncbi:hypothetical protein EJB05_11607, partial [Eragrostis curvula]
MARTASARAVARNLSLSSSSGLGGVATPSSGMDDCAELLSISVAQLGDALASRDADAVTTWLSAAMTNQATCADSLAVSAAVTSSMARQGQGGGAGDRGAHDLKLLRSSGLATSGVVMDAVVALDGSGTHRSINEAIAAVTVVKGCGGGRKVIYVKAGRYEESGEREHQQQAEERDAHGRRQGQHRRRHRQPQERRRRVHHLRIRHRRCHGLRVHRQGPDHRQQRRPGRGSTRPSRCGSAATSPSCTSARSRRTRTRSTCTPTASSTPTPTSPAPWTSSSPTPPWSSSTATSSRPRKPSPGQKDTITAQDRTDPNQDTGISIHRCSIAAASDLGVTPVYLGRPWQKYSRTVVMKTSLDRSIGPAGWLEWSGQFALSTLYYGEYGNTGAGAGTSKRVTWSGVHSSLSTSDAARFTVANFISGNSSLSLRRIM